MSLTSNSAATQTRAAFISLASNAANCIVKLIAASLSGSVSVLSEAVHSTADLAASFMALLSVRAAHVPPDYNHPYGHGKAENLAGLIEAAVLLAAGLGVVGGAIHRLERPEMPRGTSFGMAAMAFSAITNLAVGLRMKRVALQTDSAALSADAQNHLSDVFSAAGVLLGLALARISHSAWVDPAVGLAVSVFILRSAWVLGSDALGYLMDSHLPEQEMRAVKTVLEAEAAVLDYHKLRTRKSGAVRYVDAHVLMDDELSLREAHALTEALEDRIRQALPNVEVTLHTEPYREELRHQRDAHGPR